MYIKMFIHKIIEKRNLINHIKFLNSVLLLLASIFIAIFNIDKIITYAIRKTFIKGIQTLHI